MGAAQGRVCVCLEQEVEQWLRDGGGLTHTHTHKWGGLAACGPRYPPGQTQAWGSPALSRHAAGPVLGAAALLAHGCSGVMWERGKGSRLGTACPTFRAAANPALARRC